MPNWFVLLADVEVGPLSDAQFRQFAASGKMSATDQVRTDASPRYRPASQVRGLFTSPPPSLPDKLPDPPTAKADSTSPTTEAPKPTQADARDKFQNLGRMAAAFATIKKLQLVDLPEADWAAGVKAFEVGLPALLPAFTEIHLLDAKIAEARKSRALPTDATLGDRAKHAAAEAQRHLNVERLLQSRKRLLTDVGSRLRHSPELDPDGLVKPEVGAAESIASRIVELESMHPGATHRFSGKRLARAGGILIVIVAAMWVFRAVISSTPAERHAAELAAIAEARELESQRIDANRAETARRAEEGEQRREAELELARQRHQADLERRTREAEVAAQADADRLEQERQEEEQEAVARRTVEEERNRLEAETQQRQDVAARALAEREKRAAQDSRKAYAARVFGSLHFDASKLVTVAPSARKLVSGFEIRGAQVDKIRDLIAAEDWLGLVSLGDGRVHQEFPATDVIDRAVHIIQTAEYFLLVKLKNPLSSSDGDRMTFLRISFIDLDQYMDGRSLDDSGYLPIAEVDSSWKDHPDGIGVIDRWRTSDSGVALATVDPNQWRSETEDVVESVQNYRNALQQKVALGELSESVATVDLLEHAKQMQAKLRAAVMGE
jgi:hypothetical protein